MSGSCPKAREKGQLNRTLEERKVGSSISETSSFFSKKYEET